MNRLLTRNEAKYRLLRTIIQGVIGVLIANADYLVGVFHFSPETRVVIVTLVMAILSPIMAAMGTGSKELPEDYWDKLPDEISGRFGGDDSEQGE